MRARHSLLHKKLLSVISLGLCTAVLSSCSCSFEEPVVTDEPATTQPITLSEDDGVSSYGYDNLSSTQTKQLYLKIAEYAQKDAEESFIIDGEYTETQMFESLGAYKNDHPEAFWLDSTYDYYHDNGKTSIKILFVMENEELENAKKTFDAELESILDNAPKNATDYELELYFNDYLVDNCKYNKLASKVSTRVANEGSAYGAIVDKKAVCEGYARAFQLLCNSAGIDCVNVMGEADGVTHQWNCVKISDEWYHVDVTWNDPGDEEGWVQYDYFNVTTEQISNDHTLRELYSEAQIDPDAEYATIYNIFVPECTSTEYNYYNQSCVTLTDVDNADEVVSSMAEYAQNGEEYFSFVIDESLDYSETADIVINEGYLYEWVEQANELNDYSVEINPECMVYQNESFNVLIMGLEYL